MFNLLHSTSEFGIKQRKSTKIFLFNEIIDTKINIEKRLQNEQNSKEILERALLYCFIAFIIFIIFTFFKLNILFWLSAGVLFVLEVCVFILLFQNFYFIFNKTKNYIITKIIVQFIERYNYNYYDCNLKLSKKEFIKLNEFNKKLEEFAKDDRKKDSETVEHLKTLLTKDYLICLKNDFCYAKEQQEKSLASFSEIFSVFLVSGFILLLTFFFPKLEEIMEGKSYNGIFGASIVVFFALPICKNILMKTPPSIEIYTKCINLLERAIN